MKVSELIEMLESLDADALVVLSKDSEGNGFSPVTDVDPCHYTPFNTWSGECIDTDDMDDADDHPDAEPCVCLWPTN